MLALTLGKKPGATFYPDLVEGNVVLSYNSSNTQAGVSSSSSTGGIIGINGSGSVPWSGEGDGGLVWNVEASQPTTLMEWTVFPSTGLLFPDERCAESSSRSCLLVPIFVAGFSFPSLIDDIYRITDIGK